VCPKIAEAVGAAALGERFGWAEAPGAVPMCGAAAIVPKKRTVIA